ncbi:hypothetical protein chiPu_0024257 [Chiloscyllium punctatum]|uniref:Uncharacterized protein n=1 Tax=Chiloscyllium punctatum TaxID=137246 RepID=A0A401TCH8_CHIPU|nr:hypothetical protein [Chiloscyllium punctatum]
MSVSWTSNWVSRLSISLVLSSGPWRFEFEGKLFFFFSISLGRLCLPGTRGRMAAAATGSGSITSRIKNLLRSPPAINLRRSRATAKAGTERVRGLVVRGVFGVGGRRKAVSQGLG